MAEQLIRNEQVVSSILTSSSTQNSSLYRLLFLCGIVGRYIITTANHCNRRAVRLQEKLSQYPLQTACRILCAVWRFCRYQVRQAAICPQACAAIFSSLFCIPQFYNIKADLRNVQAPQEEQAASDVSALIEQLQKSPELLQTLSQLIAAKN